MTSMQWRLPSFGANLPPGSDFRVQFLVRNGREVTSGFAMGQCRVGYIKHKYPDASRRQHSGGGPKAC